MFHNRNLCVTTPQIHHAFLVQFDVEMHENGQSSRAEEKKKEKKK